MSNIEISLECKSRVARIESVFKTAKAQIDEIKNRAAIAEEMVMQIRDTATVEIQRAYQQGYNKGIQDANNLNEADGGFQKTLINNS